MWPRNRSLRPCDCDVRTNFPFHSQRDPHKIPNLHHGCKHSVVLLYRRDVRLAPNTNVEHRLECDRDLELGAVVGGAAVHHPEIDPSTHTKWSQKRIAGGVAERVEAATWQPLRANSETAFPNHARVALADADYDDCRPPRQLLILPG